MHFRSRPSTPQRRAYEMIMLFAVAIGMYVYGALTRRFRRN